MNLTEMKRKVAKILMDDIDWDDIANLVAEHKQEDMTSELVARISNDIDDDEIVESIVDLLS